AAPRCRIGGGPAPDTAVVKLSHLDQAGRARMVDVGNKPLMDRTAVATGTIRMSPDAYRQVAAQAIAKGDVLAVSEVAGTLAAKRAAGLIPLCHPLGLDPVGVSGRAAEPAPGVRGGIIVLAALLVSTVGGWAGGTTTDADRAPASGSEVLGELRSLRQQLDAKQGELEVARLQLDRVNAIMQYSTHYRLPADMA